MLYTTRGTYVDGRFSIPALKLWSVSGILISLSGCAAGFNNSISDLLGGFTGSSTTLSASTSAVTALENAGSANLTFTINPVLSQAGSLTVTAAATSTAVAGTDYNFGFTNPVSVAAGASSVSLPIAVLNNGTNDGNRQLDLNLSLTTAGSTTPVTATYSVTIRDDDQPTQLAFIVQPTNRTAGQAFASNIRVEIRDGNNNLVNTATNTVTIAIGTNPGSGTLAGTTSVAAVAGVATFPGLSINRSGTGYTLAATATGLDAATSSTFNVTHGAATQLAFLQGPSNTTGGVAISPAITVQVQDAQGNVVTSDSTTSVTLNGPTFASGATATVSSGVATFSSAIINASGSGLTINTTNSGGLTNATSSSFNVAVGPAARLTINQQPSNAQARVNVSPSITVRVEDAGGNLTTSTASVSVAISNNPSSGSLFGTTSRNAVAGVATFNDLQIDKVGTGYTLVFTSTGLTSATSNGFNITVGAASQLAWNQQPSNAQARTAISPSMTVRILDAGGNLTASTANVTLAISNNPSSGSIFGTATRAAVAGTATFNGIEIDKVGTGYTLAASSGVLTGATSDAFNITVGAASQIAFDQQPSNTVSRTNISPSITVRILDAGGNLTASTSNVTLSISTNPATGSLFGTATRAAVAGVATFDDIQIDRAGTGYRLGAALGGWTATSDLFNITVGSAAALAFVQQPSAAVQNAAISPSITVRAVDAGGNVVTGYATNIAMAIDGSNNPGSGTLAGTTSRTPSSGVSTFNDLAINNVGTGYRLRASSGSLTEALSDAFNITSACPTTINGSVVARYSIAPNWNDYALASNTANACSTASTTVYYENCIHGGEARRVNLTGIADCTGLTLTEEDGHFDWACDDNGASDAFFYTTRLKPGKGLANLLRSDGTDWENNRVTVTDTSGCTRLTTTDGKWWTNTVEAMPDAASASVQLSTASRIYTLTSNKSIAGYSVEANKVAFVTLGGAALSFNGAVTSNTNYIAQHCTNGTCGTWDSLIASHGRNYLWIEGNYIGHHATNSTYNTLFLVNNRYSRIHNASIYGGEAALALSGNISNNIAGVVSGKFTNISVGGTVGVAIKVNDNSNYNRFENISASRTLAGFEILAANNNRVFNLRVTNSEGVEGTVILRGADNTTLVNALVSNVDKAIWIGRAVGANNRTNDAIVHLTTAVNVNSDSAIFIYEVDSTTVSQALLGNNNWETLALDSSSGNWFANLALAHGTFKPIGTGVMGSYGGNNRFMQKLWLDSGSCDVTASDLLTAACAHGTAETTNPLTTSLTFSNLFEEQVTSDTTNTSDTSGVAAFSTLTNTTALLSFDKYLRAWGKGSGTAYPASAHRGHCSTGNCQIWDFSYKSGTGHALLGVNGTFTAGAACPAEADSTNASAIIPDAGATPTPFGKYLINAYEIVGDISSTGAMVGDDDGLCESNENCVFAPNVGATNGKTPASLADANTCTFTGGNGVTGVKLFGPVAD
jgi:hypothetical protein